MSISPEIVSWCEQARTLLGAPKAMPDTFEQELAKLEPLLLSAIRTAPDQRHELMTAWQSAQDQLSRDPHAAQSQLNQLAATVQQVLRAPAQSDAQRFGIQGGIVAERAAVLKEKFKQMVAKAKDSTGAGIEGLTGVLEGLIVESAGLVAAINSSLQETLSLVQADLDAALALGDSEKVLSVVQTWRERIAVDQRFVELRKAGPMLGVDPRVDARFEDLFEQVTRDLAEQAA